MNIKMISEIVVLGRPKRAENIFRALRESLDFPPYFGNNWDALANTLSAPEDWFDKKSLMLILDPTDLDLEEWNIFLQILEESKQAWSTLGLRFYVSYGNLIHHQAEWIP